MHVKETGIILGNHLILCNPLLPPFDSVSLYISLLTQMGPRQILMGAGGGKR